MTPAPAEKQVDSPNLTIGDLARRTGVTPAVLRMWETRYGFPVPDRLPSGHRRYAEEQVDLVARVLRRRDAGLKLENAIAEATSARTPGPASVFAELRRRHPALAPYRLKKSTLLALSWALEDEFCATAESPVLFATFQTAKYFEPSVLRWNELARVARSTMVFADFTTLVEDGVRPIQVPLADNSPLLREWTIVCDSVENTACLAAWEIPGQDEVPDRDRIFEAVWSVDPQAVRDASRVCARVAADAGVASAAPLLYELAEEPRTRPYDPAGTTALFNRVVAYVDRLG
ncbi:MAG: hypothetical protein JWQ74_938 [Marmoricola sp.]|nr:hypothetical protein [Marmoricola sp.]